MTSIAISPRTSISARFMLAAASLLISVSALASGGGNLQQAGTDLEDTASLQRGAMLYMNYCSGCHSLQYMRTSRIAEDLGLSEEQVMQHLNFSGAKFGEPIMSSMSPTMAEQAFRKVPPDLSLISRVRGSDWIYTYLKSFYLDEARPMGWNNTLFPNASMPNPLWEMQGNQRPVFAKKIEVGKDKEGKPVMGCAHGLTETDTACIKELVVPHTGSQTPAQFNQTVRDITAFLEYAGEPVALKRQRTGVWVILFLSFFTLLAWLLKKEYWRDVH